MEKLIEVKRYAASDQLLWDDFVVHSRQATFLLLRGYMDYHQDRFADHSLMIYRRGRLFALLPANEVDGKPNGGQERVLWSHQGLTYGGLITDSGATTERVAEAFSAIADYLRREGFCRVVYKAIPWIYHRLPSEEDLYVLTNQLHATLTARHISSAITPRRLRWPQNRRYSLHKAQKAGIRVGESHRLADFWPILDRNLQQRFGAHPVHGLEEMELLKSRFPDQIRLFTAWKADEPLAGTVVYDMGQVVHTQYISASAEGKRLCALDALFSYVLNEVYPDVPYFDFGKSSNGNGSELNTGLIAQKEGFGGRGVCYDWYEFDV